MAGAKAKTPYHAKLAPVDYTSNVKLDANGASHVGVDWGKAGGDKTVISLTPGPRASSAQIADAVRALQGKYPGAEIYVKTFDKREWVKHGG